MFILLFINFRQYSTLPVFSLKNFQYCYQYSPQFSSNDNTRRMFKFVNDREYDLVVYGATGFTGQYVVEEVARTAQKEDIKWAIGGRNADKLKSVLTVAALKTGVDVKDVPVVVADTNDEASLRAMTARAQVIINLVGPYTMYGEPVVKACLETGTHYMDVGGETLFMEEMHLKYDRVAKEKCVYLISCCCLSADLWLPVRQTTVRRSRALCRDIHIHSRYEELSH